MTGGYLERSYPEGETDQTSLGGWHWHLKFDRFYIVDFHSALSQPCHERPSDNLQCKNDQTLSVDANPLDLFDQSLLLDMIILGTHQLCGGVNIFFFYKVSFEKHPTEHLPSAVSQSSAGSLLEKRASDSLIHGVGDQGGPMGHWGWPQDNTGPPVLDAQGWLRHLYSFLVTGLLMKR